MGQLLKAVIHGNRGALLCACANKMTFSLRWIKVRWMITCKACQCWHHQLPFLGGYCYCYKYTLPVSCKHNLQQIRCYFNIKLTDALCSVLSALINLNPVTGQLYKLNFLSQAKSKHSSAGHKVQKNIKCVKLNSMRMQCTYTVY